MTSLRDALLNRLGTLPTVTYSNGYVAQALPKADLLTLLNAHPEEDAVTATPGFPDEPKPKWADLWGIDPGYTEGASIEDFLDPERKLLAATAANLGFQLGKAEGRKEAGEEIAVAIETFLDGPHAEGDDCAECSLMSQLARTARSIGSEPSGGPSEPVAASTGHSDRPEDAEAAREACPEYYPVAITRMMCVKEAGHEDDHQTTGGVTWRNRYLAKGGQ